MAIPAKDLQLKEYQPSYQSLFSYPEKDEKKRAMMEASGEIVGYIQYWNEGEELWIYYEVLPQFQKNGFATKAIYLFDEWLFQVSSVSTIHALITHEWMNTKSVLEHNGYERIVDYEEGVKYERPRKDEPKEEYMSMEEGQGVIYLAGGCFWGVESVFQLLDGVLETRVGYANGRTTNPTYEKICLEDTGYKETVCVKYAKDQISLEKILEAFFLCIDPTVSNRQGNDIGEQYQTGVYYIDEESKKIAEAVFKEKKKEYDVFCVELEPLKNFYLAEDYHQDYLIKHPNGYCHITNEEYEAVKKLNEE